LTGTFEVAQPPGAKQPAAARSLMYLIFDPHTGDLVTEFVP
jgi:hypothetical protein